MPHEAAPAADPALRIRGLRKEFPGLVALRDVDLDVAQGEVHALVGENGAGKSTLIKIVAGALAPDAGTVVVAGRPLVRSSPGAAARAGVAVIHQDRQIGLDLSVAENVLLGRLPERLPGVVDWRAAHRRAAELLAQVGLDVDPRTRASELGVAEHQTLEIARALNGDARLVIMDEPTASLSGGEIEKLFEVIRRIRARGRTVIYISHHLEEIFGIADNVTVLRDGLLVATRRVDEIDARELTRLMFGRDVRQLERAMQGDVAEPGPTALEARGLHAPPFLHGVDLAARSGEVVCITGGIGSGRRELARCLAGALRPERGEVRAGRRLVRSPRQAIRSGIGFVPDDRKQEGVLLPLDLVENVDLSRLAIGRDRFVRARPRRARIAKLASELRIKYRGLDRPVQELSGGNQQKALLARLLAYDAKVLVLDEPTNGVDVNTKLELYGFLRRLAGAGACVIVFSSDVEEIKLLADRVLVMRRGRIVDELAPHEVSESRLLAVDKE